MSTTTDSPLSGATHQYNCDGGRCLIQIVGTRVGMIAPDLRPRGQGNAGLGSRGSSSADPVAPA